MIAEVYPLIRLPRNKQVFDYLIPESLTIVRGSFVRIPYRTKELWGVVRNVKDKPPRGITLKTVVEVYEDLALKEEELSFFEHMAHDLAQSTASVLLLALPTPPKRKGSLKPSPLSWLPLTLPNSEAEHVVRIVHTLQVRGKAFIQTPDLRRSAAIILGFVQNNPDQKVLILAPTVRDVKLLKSRITGTQPIIITGEESNNERFRAWQEFRSLPSGILLGTRTALLTVDANITTIFVLRSGDYNHKQHDRNPRFDARELVWLHQKIFASRLFFLDVAPQPSTLARFQDSERLNWGVYPTTKVININQERTASIYRVVTYSAGAMIDQALQQGQQVICVFNKKGGARELRCGECAHRFLCPACQTPLTAFSHTLECARCRHKEPLALRCPSCNGSQLKPIGLGNHQVQQELKALFPNAQIAIVDKEHPDLPQADILLVTTFFYESLFDPFKKNTLGAVIHLNVDAPLYNAKPAAVEDLLRDVWQWAWVGFSRRVPVLFQTASPDLVQSSIEHPFETAKTELDARTRYHLPPVYRWSRIVLKEDERRKAEIAMRQLADEFARVPEIMVYPLSWNHDGHAYLDCGVPEESFEALLYIFTTLPDRYIIDTNAFT